MGERELGCIGIWASRECYCALLYLPIYCAVEIGSLSNHVNSCVLCVYLLFNFRLFTVIDLSPGVLSAQH